MNLVSKETKVGQRKFWVGSVVDSLLPNQVMVFGSNPEGRHGKGAAKAAVGFGARYGVGRGHRGQTYAIITKNLTARITRDGVYYPNAGLCSITPDQIVASIIEMYKYARVRPDLDFLVSYVPSNKKSLNGYTANQTHSMFFRAGKELGGIPSNIIFNAKVLP